MISDAEKEKEKKNTKHYKVCVPASGSMLLLLENVSELLNLPEPEELLGE
jgi:hypothetical protein